MKLQSCDWFSLEVQQLAAGYSGGGVGFGLCLQVCVCMHLCVYVYIIINFYMYFIHVKYITLGWKATLKHQIKLFWEDEACLQYIWNYAGILYKTRQLFNRPCSDTEMKEEIQFTHICKIELGGINTQQATSDSSCTCLGQKHRSTSFTPGLSNTSCFWPGYRYSSSKLLAGPPWRARATWLLAASELLNSWGTERAQHLSGTNEIRPTWLKEQQQLRYRTDKATHHQPLKMCN